MIASFKAAALLLAGYATFASASFLDCDPSGERERAFGTFTPEFHNEIVNSTTFYSLLPKESSKPLPLMVFMHGSTGQWEFYNDNLELLSSHGTVIVFPFIKDPEKDKKPLTTNTDGTYLIKAIEYATEMNSNEESVFFNRIDLSNIIIAGHSMGATCSINASHKLKDNKNIKLTATLHPGICGPFGPPPCPSCWTTETLEEVASARPLLFTTATNDGAFWPAPHTAEHEYGCYLKSVGESDDTGNLHPLAFVQFNADVCAEDGNREPLIEDSGHMCVSKNVVDGVAPEFEWLIKAVKLFGQLGGDEKSVCYSMIYGEESNSLKMANETDVLDIRI